MFVISFLFFGGYYSPHIADWTFVSSTGQ